MAVHSRNERVVAELLECIRDVAVMNKQTPQAVNYLQDFLLASEALGSLAIAIDKVFELGGTMAREALRKARERFAADETKYGSLRHQCEGWIFRLDRGLGYES